MTTINNPTLSVTLFLAQSTTKIRSCILNPEAHDSGLVPSTNQHVVSGDLQWSMQMEIASSFWTSKASTTANKTRKLLRLMEKKMETLGPLKGICRGSYRGL